MDPIIMNETGSGNSAILQIEGLKKYFPIRRGFFQKITGWVRAVEDVSFTIEKGKTLGLVGESGCGKTTVARLILKLLDADAGKILFDNLDIAKLDEKEMKPLRKEIQIIFQDPYGSLNPRMTIGQSISEGLKIAGFHKSSEQRQRLENLLKMVGMSPASIDRFPHEFSGGQRQRIGIARALSVEPSLIICDEPISALDVSIQAQIINLLKDLQEQLGLSYLFISHDLNVVGYICDMVAVMYKGHIMEYSPADELFDHPIHPYTHLLLSAVPESELSTLKENNSKGDGTANTLTAPSGCSFQPRCPISEDRCRQSDIDFVKAGENHLVRCWKTAKNGAYNFSLDPQ
jgi:oligopeptide/dipeptide ABC transporter ATP-binding protein